MTQRLIYCGYLGEPTLSDIPINYPKDIDISLITNNDSIVKISSGGYHSLILTENKKIYGIGSNNDFQLSIRKSTNRTLSHNYDRPIEISSYFYLDKNIHVCDVVATCRSSFLILNNGKILSFGSNAYGQLGRDDYSDNPIGYVGKFLDNTMISQGINKYRCYMNGTFFWGIHVMTICKKIFSFGDNESYKLGLDGIYDSIVYRPTENIHLRNKGVIKASTGSNHSIFLTKCGKVYTSGSNYFGQLGNNVVIIDEYDKKTPSIVVNLESVKIIDICALSNANICLSNDMKIYVFGCNVSNKIGLSDKIKYIGIPTLLKLHKIKKISALSNSAFFIQKYGSIFSCGLNDKKQIVHMGNELDEIKNKNIDFHIDQINGGAFYVLMLTPHNIKKQIFKYHSYRKLPIHYNDLIIMFHHNLYI